MTTHEKTQQKHILKLDGAILITEFGAFLTWMAVTAEMTHAPNPALYTAVLWALTRIQRVVFGGAIGRLIDNTRDRLRLFILSMLLYAIMIGAPAFFESARSPISLVLIMILLPIGRLTAALARMTYVKSVIEGETLTKQVKLMENLPLIASGLSSLALILAPHALTLQVCISIDFALHLFAIVLVYKANLPAHRHQSAKTPLFSFREEVDDLTRTFSNLKLRRAALHLFSVVLLFGSFPIVVSFFSGEFGPSNRMIYAYYGLGLAVSSLVAAVFAQRSIALSTHPRTADVALIAMAILQPLSIALAHQHHEQAGFILWLSGTLISIVFLLLMGESRAKIVLATNQHEAGRALASVTRGEFLFGGALALAMGPILAQLGSFGSAAVLAVFLPLALWLAPWRKSPPSAPPKVEYSN